MGSGKSTIGRIIAKKLNLPLVDVDKKVSGKLGMKPVEVYDRFGDSYYRAMETVALNDLIEEGKPAVIVLGSGLALMEQNDAYLKANDQKDGIQSYGMLTTLMLMHYYDLSYTY